MKTLVVLYADFKREYAHERLFGGVSAFERALAWVKTVPGAARLLVLTGASAVPGGTALLRAAVDNAFPAAASGGFPANLSEKNCWSALDFFETLAAEGGGFDAIVFGFGDCPFYDSFLTESLLETHMRYAAEYTFADGYPAGLTPEILHPASCAIIAALLKKDGAVSASGGACLSASETVPFRRDMVFESIKKDINAFEIETVIAPEDLRYLRLLFACDSKRNALQCLRAFEACGQNPSAEKLCAVSKDSSAVQRTLPAFFNIQISAACTGSCSFCPYPAANAGKYGVSPRESAQFMDFERFRILMRDISSFAGDGTVCLSLWGDCVLHPRFEDFVRETLSYPDFSLLLETDGSAVTSECASKIAQIAGDSPLRTDGRSPVIWIVGIDAAEARLYEKLHGTAGFEKACASAEILLEHFPGAVYPQFVRMNENEEQMETFYRYWQKKCGRVIIQKYDCFSGILEQKKVADLTPLRRNPCWHLRRDLCILVDGSVPRCRTALLSDEFGSVFEDGCEKVWERGSVRYAGLLAENRDTLCESCDEYYTFNF